MSLFKCKMCGGDLEIAEGVTIAECEYCGTKQTVPRAMDENLQNLFNRANTLRIKSEFDKAEKLYEKIIQADTTQSEAYWGLILCKYGIEYVDDPATFKKIPTCHRASYDSIIADDDYKSAIENADMSQRAIYEEQAKEIDRIQKEILALAQKEETYDVFICYKETDSDGHRTQDSVIANDIYYQLTEEGFKVFYAAITLEGKLGSAYEPIIFAALNSAKVMLAIGTKPEYFNAVWVKNEWSRFLKIIKKDRSKLLIPCYRDMDAYELPEEFAHLQAQDMAKIGFINDLVRGIKKVVKKDEPKKETVVKETVVTATNANTSPLLKRAFMFLEDGDWQSSNEYCEKVLDIDPECAEAYLGKLMAELHVKKQDQLKNCPEPFGNRNNYQKAVRFANDALKNSLEKYLENVIEKKKKADEKRQIQAEELKERTKQREVQCQEFAKELNNLLIQYGDQETISKKQQSLKSDLTNFAKQIESLKLLENSFTQIQNDLETTKSEINAAESEIIKLSQEREKLGLFSIKQKKDIDSKKYNINQQLSVLNQHISSLKNKLQGFDDISSVSQAIKSFEDKFHETNELFELLKSIQTRKEELKSFLHENDQSKLSNLHRQFVEQKYKVGSYISLGEYQTKPLEWIVLTIKDHKALLLSKYVIETDAYERSSKMCHVEWEYCSLNNWLNHTFINHALSPERKFISSVDTSNEISFATNNSRSSSQKIFILSVSEIEKYTVCQNNAVCSHIDRPDNSYSWWVRSPGVPVIGGNAAAVLDYNGNIDSRIGAGSTIMGIRPAMWIDLNKLPISSL